jgi:putative DNA primase/helicase
VKSRRQPRTAIGGKSEARAKTATSTSPSPNVWAGILSAVRPKINPLSFETWLKPSRLLPSSNGKLRVRFPKMEFIEWVKEHHLSEITAEAKKAGFDCVEFFSEQPEPQPAVEVEEPPAASIAGSSEGPEHLTDSGNARRLVNLHGKDLRYCPPFGRWLIWDGTRWKPDETREIVRRMKAALKSIYVEAEQTSHKREREELDRWAKVSEGQGKIQAAISLAESEREIIVMPDALDCDPWLFNCANGTVDLRTGELRAHRRGDRLTKRAGVEYHPNAECPVFEQFLNRIMGGNSELKVYLQTAIGYSLTGLTREQCVFILHGTGANGKSTLLEILRALFGDYAMNSDFTTFAVRDRTGASGDLARLAGARFVTAIETEPGEKLSLSRIKQVTGGDRVTARHLFQSEFEFTPQFKLWVAVNHLPQVRSTEHAIWRRIRRVPFDVTIPDAEQDKDLLEKLRAELPGILAWAVEGCRKWQKPGLKTPSEIAEATEEYREDTDRLHDFLEDCCEKYDDAETAISELYEAYVRHSEKNHEKPMSMKAFAIALLERGFEPVRFGKRRTRNRKGIRLLPAWRKL